MTTPIDSIRRGINQTFAYAGRTSRAEYWWYAVSLGVLGAITNTVLLATEAATGSAVPLLFRTSMQVVITLTLLSSTVRRLHDTGKSAYWVIPGAAAAVSVWVLTSGGNPANAADVTMQSS